MPSTSWLTVAQGLSECLNSWDDSFLYINTFPLAVVFSADVNDKSIMCLMLSVVLQDAPYFFIAWQAIIYGSAKIVHEGAVFTSLVLYASSCLPYSNFQCKLSCGCIRSTRMNKSCVLSYDIIKTSALFFTYSRSLQRVDVGTALIHKLSRRPLIITFHARL